MRIIKTNEDDVFAVDAEIYNDGECSNRARCMALEDSKEFGWRGNGHMSRRGYGKQGRKPWRAQARLARFVKRELTLPSLG